ncbi:molybdenum cofactor biosynthesis protein C [Anoxybacter fermentans]|uniref:Cyclic pyranopterin monophosphate synthase n=1 Tax=Anoxybacter fermentans TaxID=1323375 RepID=A0A3S9SUL9_9FIRM|nr:cyclic pyranopterin monophosphate synthase MoaC [Anoxybacter fermentans]AZR72001.1 molybdenum cofactor biosynthesis protein C [Anoxybacter fermentans]
MEKRLTHLNEAGRARMIDITEKDITKRTAVAKGRIKTSPETLRLIKNHGLKKGDVLAVAQVAGIMGAKKTSEIIPMCHPINLTGVDLDFQLDEKKGVIEIEAMVKVTGQTGVEMEALTAVSVAALTIYDMCKAVDKGMVIEEIYLVKKTGGKSGDFYREK